MAPSDSTSKSKTDTKEIPFEAALQRLEEVVNAMEDGDLSLDAMMAHFEEGTRLSRQCEEKLKEVEQKIEQMVKSGDEIGTEPFTLED